MIFLTLLYLCFLTLEHPLSPNRLPTPKFHHKPCAVHFQVRGRNQMWRYLIVIQYPLELSFHNIHMYIDHCPSEHPSTWGFSVGSPWEADGSHGIHSSYSRNGHLLGRVTTLCCALFNKKNMKKKHAGWKWAHAFFLIMGGFTLHEGGKPMRVLEAKELENLSKERKIEWPTITEEITDRSKGDYLSKTIVLLQMIWFIIQCIARGAYRLPLTELEVITIVFSSLTGVIYYL